RRIEANLGEAGDTLRNDNHPDLRADYTLVNPPFNIKSWGQESLLDDPRWIYGVPPKGNANYAWILHMVSKLSENGVAGFVLANGSMSSTQSGEGDIRRAMIEGDVVDCMIALPGQLFYSTQIPACLWFLAKNKKNGGFRNREKEILFIDARKLGVMVDRTRREFTDEDIAKISDTYHRWREGRDYEDVPGFCKSAGIEEIKGHGYVLTPGRYVGAAAAEDDGVAFEERFASLKEELEEHFALSDELTTTIRERLQGLR
ncbi:MAG: SAM-dependent DNA methyltransferase, partial [Bacteroidetes bacterium]|nr:SAM-dependent DNA methyltransferase [Bacteroidota bacterium]